MQYGNSADAAIRTLTANASTEHIAEQIDIKFSEMRFIALSSTLPVHHAMTQQVNESGASFATE